MSILNGRLKPNGNCDQILGTELQKYFGLLESGKLKIKTKPQNIEVIQKQLAEKTVREVLCKVNDPDNIATTLELDSVMDTKVANISGGELQRLVCTLVLCQQADVYIFDEFTNYLDITQRLKVAGLIQNLSSHDKYIFVVEHDMSILDYLSDVISILYGEAGAYGVVSLPHQSCEAINMYFEGYIQSENIKFRSESFSMKDNVLEYDDNIGSESGVFDMEYPDHLIEYPNFSLQIPNARIRSNTPIVMLMGRNGTGKTSYLNYIKDALGLSVSYKQQYVNLPSDLSVRDLLYSKIKSSMCSEIFVSDVLKPLQISKLYDRMTQDLSGGEAQRVAIALSLGTPANIYLIDEPSAGLDIEYRMIITRVLRRFMLHNHKTGFIVEHDINMCMSLGSEHNSQIIVFEKNDNLHKASDVMSFKKGINMFLKQLDITFRIEPRYRRPRINKKDSQKDREQKLSGNYYI